MRDRETIDSELRRIALGRRSVRERGGQPSSQEVDRLLDELLAHNAGVSLPDPVEASQTGVVAEPWPRGIKAGPPPRRRTGVLRKGVLRRLSLSAALPLSLIAVVVAVVAMFAVRHHDSAEQAAETPASAAPPPNQIAPKAPPAPAARADVADAAFIGALKHEGVPIPSPEYVTAKGHAVCAFLAHEPNFTDAAGFVQRSSIWDANQSAEVTAGAIVAYCPQSQPSNSDQLTPAYQNTLSDLQAIEGKLQGIQGNLQDIQGSLDNLPGHP